MSIKINKKETRGRKRLQKNKVKNKRLPVAFSLIEIEHLKKRASNSGKSFTEFIRDLLERV